MYPGAVDLNQKNRGPGQTISLSRKYFQPPASRTQAATASDALKLIGSRLRPPRNEVSIQAGSPASAMASTRFKSSRKKITISILARYMPMQAWMPKPKPMWRLGLRSAMNENGFSKASSSRLADG